MHSVKRFEVPGRSLPGDHPRKDLRRKLSNGTLQQTRSPSVKGTAGWGWSQMLEVLVGRLHASSWGQVSVWGLEISVVVLCCSSILATALQNARERIKRGEFPPIRGRGYAPNR